MTFQTPSFYPLAESYYLPFSIFGTNATLQTKRRGAIEISVVAITSGKKNEEKKVGSKQLQLAVFVGSQKIMSPFYSYSKD
ncbi:MAG: hypothetical protein KDC64_06505 [Aequorivita sp.]|nr:hypothetical protein [Aequorivita sp.]MCB0467846.1 hypothetical protein [Aequorivita sp.]